MKTVQDKVARRNSVWLFLTLLVSCWPLQSPLWGESSQSAYFLPLGVILLASLVFLASRSVRSLFWINMKRSPHIILYCLTLMGSQFVAVVVYSEEPTAILTAAGYVFVTLTVYLLFPIVINQITANRWWGAVFRIGLVSALMGLLNAFTGVDDLGIIRLSPGGYFFINGLYSTSGPFHEPNIFGFFLIISTIGGLYFYSLRQRRKLALFAITVYSLALFFTWSRGMYVAWLITMGLWFFWNTNRKEWFPLLVSLLMLLAIVGAMLPEITAFIESLFTLSLGLTGRDVLWGAAVRAIIERPISGYGFGNLVDPVFSHGGDAWFWRPTGSHNGFLDVGVQAGIGSMVLYILTILVSLTRLNHARMERVDKRALLVGIISSILAVTFLSYLLGGASLGSLLIAILLGRGNFAPYAAKIKTREQVYAKLHTGSVSQHQKGCPPTGNSAAVAELIQAGQIKDI